MSQPAKNMRQWYFYIVCQNIWAIGLVWWGPKAEEPKKAQLIVGIFKASLMGKHTYFISTKRYADL